MLNRTYNLVVPLLIFRQKKHWSQLHIISEWSFLHDKKCSCRF